MSSKTRTGSLRAVPGLSEPNRVSQARTGYLSIPFGCSFSYSGFSNCSFRFTCAHSDYLVFYSGDHLVGMWRSRAKYIRYWPDLSCYSESHFGASGIWHPCRFEAAFSRHVRRQINVHWFSHSSNRHGCEWHCSCACEVMPSL